MKRKVALAFSGGLDTSFCVKYLSLEKDLEVHSVFINTGGFSKQEEEKIENRARSLGVATHKTIDVAERYYQKCIRYLVYGNMMRNHHYPMSVSSERIFQAMAVVEYAQDRGIRILAHGSTGAGNDQVRFDMIFQILAPEMEVLAPIRELELSREAEVEYLRKAGFNESFEKHAYSINQGLWGTTVGGKETLTSGQGLPEEAYPSQLKEVKPKDLTVEFDRGELVGGVASIRRIQQEAAALAIGRGIHIGETIIGIKGRVGFEAAAPAIIIRAHQELEKHTLGKWQAYWKDQLSEWYGMMLHEGQYLDPVMRNIEKFLEDTQLFVSGKVYLTLRPYTFQVNGIESEHDLMKASGATYGEMNVGWSGEDVIGFTRILSNPARLYHSIHPYKS
ncbi:MAG: argininosuccinate synthase [Bacteroides sp. SM23_62]|nr:MAG: argininosuccinate synthase [Bacteroides sp. SM23_62]